MSDFDTIKNSLDEEDRRKREEEAQNAENSFTPYEEGVKSDKYEDKASGFGEGAHGKEKKNPKTFSKGIIAACMIASLLLGMAGGALTTSLMMNNDEELKTKVIYQAVQTNFDGQEAASGQSLNIEDIVALVKDSVVEITTEQRVTDYWLSQYVTEGAGSGVIISSDGYIVTNNHVIDDAAKITVTLTDGTQYEAQVVGADEKTDISVIKIGAADLKPAIYGDSDSLQVGNLVVAIGNPLGQLGGTVTNGIISALDREITIDGETMSLMQITAAVNPGNSGGGLFDGKGQLIGIVNAKSSGSNIEGLGFAIPINDVKTVVESLINFGYVPGRAQLGVIVIDITDVKTAMSYRVQKYGTYILEVEEGSGAQAAGLKPGDYLVSVDGKSVEKSSDLKAAIEEHSVGDTLKLVIERDGEEIEMNVALGESVPN